MFLTLVICGGQCWHTCMSPVCGPFHHYLASLCLSLRSWPLLASLTKIPLSPFLCCCCICFELCGIHGVLGHEVGFVFSRSSASFQTCVCSVCSFLFYHQLRYGMFLLSGTCSSSILYIMLVSVCSCLSNISMIGWFLFQA